MLMTTWEIFSLGRCKSWSLQVKMRTHSFWFQMDTRKCM